jgi:hypothetical protein
MNGFTKLHSSILSSTIWRQDPETKVVWITLMALADRDGVAQASIPGLAHFAGVSVEATEAAIQKFLSPDPWSRTPDREGRRIEKVDGGWRLLNHAKYREKMSRDDIREKAAIRQQRKRDRDAVTQKRDAGVTKRDERDESRMSRHTEAEAEAEAEEQNQNPCVADAPLPPQCKASKPTTSDTGCKLDEKPPLSLARHILTEACIPTTSALIETVASTIDALAKEESCEQLEAAERLCTRTVNAIGNGAKVNTFWFQERKWSEKKAEPAKPAVKPMSPSAHLRKLREEAAKKDAEAATAKTTAGGAA